jgi:hypothetical protein
MNKMGYLCTDCNKEYKSYTTLWNHNRIKHDGVKTVKSELPISPDGDKNLLFKCRNCPKVYKHKQSRFTHERTCTGDCIELQIENKRIIALDKERDILHTKKEILELQLKIRNANKINPKTFKALNKILIERSANNTMTNSNIFSNNSNCNTQIINHNYFPNITSIGKENVCLSLTSSDKMLILDSKRNSLEKIVELVHCGTHNEFKNIIITNLKDKFVHKYDSTKGYFTAVDKSELLEKLVTFRIMDLEAIYDELSSANKIDQQTKGIIQKFLDQLESGEAYIDDTGQYENFKAFKTNSIKILLYNNQDKITKDIALLLN